MKSLRNFLIASMGTFLAMIHVSAKAQFVEVPTVVVKAFDVKFPDAKEVNWQHNIGKPEVKFKNDNKDYWARFTNKGVWEASEIKTTMEELPAEVQDGFHKSKYTEWPIKDIKKVEKPEGVTYKLNISKGTLSSRTLVFSDKGKLLKD
ncbi:MAG: hypothetical protein C5B52_02265 [Bacteroidetes bacterium]|nr:MAG: hypothetical protein C5B52_02265 [Bacteroidota bacterium]